MVCEGVSDWRHAEARKGRHRFCRAQSLHRLQESHCRLSLGHPAVVSGHAQGGQVRLLQGFRFDAGLQPACVTKCVTGCLSFGVANKVPDRVASAMPGLSSPSSEVRLRRGKFTSKYAQRAQIARRQCRHSGGCRAACAASPMRSRASTLLNPTPLQRLQRVQESGLAECGGAGEPIDLAWRQFLRGHGSSVLVIDSCDRPRCAGTRYGYCAR